MNAIRLTRMTWSRGSWPLIVLLSLLIAAVFVAVTRPATPMAATSASVSDITRVPYAASVACRPDGCTVMTGLIEVGTRVVRADDGAGCVLRTVTLTDTAPLAVPIVEAVDTTADGAMVARIQSFAQLPMPAVHSVDVPTPCPIARRP